MLFRPAIFAHIVPFFSVASFFLVSLAASGLGSPALAHHSFAMFDQTQVVNVTGTVTRFDWQNPHTWLYLSTEGEGGAATAYSFETSSPSSLMSTGWTADSVHVGDRVEIDFHPLRDGTNGG